MRPAGQASQRPTGQALRRPTEKRFTSSRGLAARLRGFASSVARAHPCGAIAAFSLQDTLDASAADGFADVIAAEGGVFPLGLSSANDFWIAQIGTGNSAAYTNLPPVIPPDGMARLYIRYADPSAPGPANPEPGVMGLAAAGLGGLVLFARRRR